MTDTSETLGWPDDEDGADGPRAGERPTHDASGLMPAQEDAALDDIAPERVARTDAFGRTPDER